MNIVHAPGSHLLRGSWDLVLIRVINEVTTVTIAYHSNYKVLVTLLTKSHDSPSVSLRDHASCEVDGSGSHRAPHFGRHWSRESGV